MNLHEKYAALVEKKPEMKVPYLLHETDGWILKCQPLADGVVAALITAYLMGRLPEGAIVVRTERWSITYNGFIYTHNTLLHALLSFHMEYPS